MKNGEVCSLPGPDITPIISIDVRPEHSHDTISIRVKRHVSVHIPGVCPIQGNYAICANLEIHIHNKNHKNSIVQFDNFYQSFYNLTFVGQSITLYSLFQ